MITPDAILASLVSDGNNCPSAFGSQLDAARAGVEIIHDATQVASAMHDRLLADAEVMDAVKRLSTLATIPRTSDLKTLPQVVAAAQKPAGLVVLTALRLYQQSVLQDGQKQALGEVYSVMTYSSEKRWPPPEGAKAIKTAEKAAVDMYGDCLIALGEFCRSYKR